MDDPPTTTNGRISTSPAFGKAHEPAVSGGGGPRTAHTPGASSASLLEQMIHLYEQTRAAQQRTEANLVELSRTSREPMPSHAETNGAPPMVAVTREPVSLVDNTAGSALHEGRSSASLPTMGADPPSRATPTLATNKGSVMRPKEFDGKQSVNSFLSQFEVCATFNQWGRTTNRCGYNGR